MNALLGTYEVLRLQLLSTDKLNHNFIRSATYLHQQIFEIIVNQISLSYSSSTSNLVKPIQHLQTMYFIQEGLITKSYGYPKTHTPYPDFCKIHHVPKDAK